MHQVLGKDVKSLKESLSSLKLYLGCATASAALFITCEANPDSADVKRGTKEKLQSKGITLPKYLMGKLES